MRWLYKVRYDTFYCHEGEDVTLFVSADVRNVVIQRSDVTSLTSSVHPVLMIELIDSEVPRAESS